MGLFPLITSCLAPVSRNEEASLSEEAFSPDFSPEYSIPGDFDFGGKVARWPGFREAAASITFDDGTYDQYNTAWPILEKKGVKGTFYLAAGLIGTGDWNDHGTVRRMMDWDQASAIAETGHEIGSHSLNHVDVTAEGVDLDVELRESRELIEARIPDISVETFCWPHWRETAETMEKASRHYISARSGNGIISYYYSRKGGIPSDPPSNMYAVNALGILNSQSEEEWREVADRVYKEKSWFVTSFHGFEPAGGPTAGAGWSSLSEEMFEAFLDFLLEKEYWIDTFAAVSKYIYERDASVLRLINRGTNLELTLDDGLDDSVYNRKLTLSLNLPNGWENPSLYTSEGIGIPVKIEDGKLQTEILPDGSSLFLKPY